MPGVGSASVRRRTAGRRRDRAIMVIAGSCQHCTAGEKPLSPKT